jgi:hypothetical protein
MTFVRETLSGETPHQRVEKFFISKLGSHGQEIADMCFKLGQDMGTSTYDMAIEIALEEANIEPQELLDFIQLV